ncbi:MAG: multicopper oxidase family protein [Psychrobium sp.]
MHSRRYFLKALSVGTASLVIASCGGGKNKGGSTISGSNFITPPNSGTTHSNQLLIPDLVDTRNTTTDLWIGKQQFDFGLNAITPTFAYNTAETSLGLLGPTLLMEKGATSTINYINNIDEVTTAHQHGLHVDGINDGGPQSSIKPGGSRANVLSIDQQAGFHWYHPHPHGRTAPQVISGLAGMIIIQDPEEIARLPNLPREYGVNDIPLVIQDKSFNNDGTIAYDINKNYGKRGYLGENILVNGKSSPSLTTPPGWIRLRILNGSNARFYERDDSLSLSNNKTFYVIASDGGLLEKPVATSALPLGPGERYEIMVQLSVGEALSLFAGPRSIMSISASDTSVDNSASELPATLAAVPALSVANVVRKRSFELKENMTINDKKMNMMVIDEAIKLGDVEQWRVFGKGAKHTFHVHGCSFKVISRGGGAPEPWETGWKDTVIVSGKREVEFLVQFNKRADKSAPYMYHCHMLEHEDMGMMGQFTVT